MKLPYLPTDLMEPPPSFQPKAVNLDEDDFQEDVFNRCHPSRGSLKAPSRSSTQSTSTFTRSKTLSKAEGASHKKKAEMQQEAKSPTPLVSDKVCLKCEHIIVNQIWKDALKPKSSNASKSYASKSKSPNSSKSPASKSNSPNESKLPDHSKTISRRKSSKN